MARGAVAILHGAVEEATGADQRRDVWDHLALGIDDLLVVAAEAEFQLIGAQQRGE